MLARSGRHASRFRTSRGAAGAPNLVGVARRPAERAPENASTRTSVAPATAAFSSASPQHESVPSVVIMQHLSPAQSKARAFPRTGTGIDATRSAQATAWASSITQTASPATATSRAGPSPSARVARSASAPTRPPGAPTPRHHPRRPHTRRRPSARSRAARHRRPTRRAGGRRCRLSAEKVAPSTARGDLPAIRT